MNYDSGRREVDHLPDFLNRYPGLLRSDNTVVNGSGKFIAIKFDYIDGLGNGKVTFLFDVDKYDSRKSRIFAIFET